jgi:2'-5' RNA ligase
VPVANRSALLVTVPEAERVVGAHRARHDRSAAWGVPAHVTVLFPFVPPAEVDASVRDRLARAIASVPAFEATFATTGWFGTEVLWLAPEPATAFGSLTAAVVAAFPTHLPYEGAHDEVVPHLTVGHDGPVAALEAAETEVRRRLPLTCPVDAVGLWCGTDAPGAWHEVETFPLG